MSHILHEHAEPEVPVGEPIIAEIFRFDPSVDQVPTRQTFCVPYCHRMSIFTLLREIYEKQDPSLAFRNQQCGRGLCGNCHIRVGINGKTQKGCTIPLKPGDHVVIEPFHPDRVIRDLVVKF